MLNRIVHSQRVCFVSAMLIAVPAIAYAPTPSQEFWEYMADYADDNGDVIDPLEYDQILRMKEIDAAPIKEVDTAREHVPADKPIVNKVSVRNSDMKFEQKSSLQNSSVGTKGAGL